MNIKKIIKRVAFKIFPDSAIKFSSIRSRKSIEKMARELGQDDKARAVQRATGGRIPSGPFEGMVLDYEALPVNSAPKLLGTYEKEIRTFVEDAISRSPKEVVDVGSSDGYYVIGFARALPKTIVYAADGDPKSLKATIKNALLNNVEDRVKTIGILHSGSFGKYLKTKGSLIVMDCEGAEFELLNPIKDPILQDVYILVEVHEHAGSTETLVNRFAKTHNSSIVEPTVRIVSESPMEIQGYDSVDLMDEWRGGPQKWLYLTPKKACPT